MPRRYNENWLVARHGYKTPARVREEQTTPTLAAALQEHALQDPLRLLVTGLTPPIDRITIAGRSNAIRRSSMEDWPEIQFWDIPSRTEFEELTIAMLYQGISNSDRMRDTIRQRRKIKIHKAKGNWNESPSDKFVNEHAWVLEDLMVRRVIEKLSEKEYRIVVI